MPYSGQEPAFTLDSPTAEGFAKPERVEYMLVEIDSLERMIAQAIDMEDGCSQMEAKANRTNPSCLCEWCAAQTPPVPWLTERTQRIEIAVASYNPEYGLITLSGVNFFLNRGSFVFKRVEMMSSWIDLWATPISQLVPMLFFDFIWLSMLLYIVIGESKEIGHIICKRGWRRCLCALYEEYLGVYNLVDWISIISAIQAIVYFILLMQEQGALNDEFAKLMDFSTSDRAVYASQVQSCFEALENVCSIERSFRLSLCFYPIVVMIRLFKSFAAQPRLAVVTETLRLGGQDLMHFAIIFCSVFACLCLDAVLLFGQDLEEYATFWRALHSCFRLMFGDWDWKAMEQVNRVVAGIWFWIFMLIVVMVMFNVLLAIIMDSYMQVKKTAQNAESLYTTMSEMRRRRNMFKAGKRVRLNDIWNGLLAKDKKAGLGEDEFLENDEKLTPDMVMDLVPNLKIEQAERTLSRALKEHQKENEKPLDLKDANHRLVELGVQTQKIRNDLLETFATVHHYDTMGQQDGTGKPDDISKEIQDMAIAAATSQEAPVNQQVLDSISSEVSRLTAEVASQLAQTMKSVDKRQGHLEQRQKEMLGAVREMQIRLQVLQSEALALTTKLNRYAHRKAYNPRKMNAGSGVPSCIPSFSNEGLPPR